MGDDLFQGQTHARTTMEAVGSYVFRRPKVAELVHAQMTSTPRNAIAFHCFDVAGSSRNIDWNNYSVE